MRRRIPVALLVGSALVLPLPPWGAVDTRAAEIAPAVESPEPRFAIATQLDRTGRILAPVYVDGQGPLLFMVDTGANRTVLAESTVQRLSLLRGTTQVSVQGVNGRTAAATVHVRRLISGAISFADVELPVLAGPVMDHIDGILGMDGFAGKKISADFLHDRIEINESHGIRARDNRVAIRGRLVAGLLLMVEARVGRIPVRAIIDTGSPRTLGNPTLQHALGPRHGRRDDGQSITHVVDATDQQQVGRFSLSPDVSLGSVTISNTVITYGNFDIFRVWGLKDEPALLVGMDVLGTLAELSIDYRRRELQLLMRGS